MYEKGWDEKEELQRIVNDDRSTILVFDDHIIKGFVFAFAMPWCGMIFQLCVSKQHQRQGIGSQLLHAAEEFLRQENCHRVALFVTEKPIEKFYKRHNYKKDMQKLLWLDKDL